VTDGIGKLLASDWQRVSCQGSPDLVGADFGEQHQAAPPRVTHHNDNALSIRRKETVVAGLRHGRIEVLPDTLEHRRQPGQLFAVGLVGRTNGA
jgi:hypothetical protein